MTIKVGDTLYLLHSYGRQGDPKWTEHVITGETAQSWLIGAGYSQEKVNKNTMRTKQNWQGGHDLYRTAQQRNDRDFCDAWRRPLMTAVEQCKEPEKLKKIAEILGMELA